MFKAPIIKSNIQANVPGQALMGFLKDYEQGQAANEQSANKLLGNMVAQKFNEKELAQKKLIAEKKLAAQAAIRSDAKKEAKLLREANLAGSDALLKAYGTKGTKIVEKDVAPWTPNSKLQETMSKHIDAETKKIIPIDTSREGMKTEYQDIDTKLEALNTQLDRVDTAYGKARSGEHTPAIAHLYNAKSNLNTQINELENRRENLLPIRKQEKKEVDDLLSNIGATTQVPRAELTQDRKRGLGLLYSTKVATDSATTDSMINSLVESYQAADTPRKKIDIAGRIQTLRNAQIASQADNADKTHDLNKILVEQTMKNKGKLLETEKLDNDAKTLLEFVDLVPNKSDSGFFGAIANQIVGNGYGRATERKMLEYAQIAKNDGVSNDAIKQALTTATTNNWFFDDDMRLDPQGFVELAKKIQQGSKTIKR